MMHQKDISASPTGADPIERVRRGKAAVWLRNEQHPHTLTMADVAAAVARFKRFEPVLRQLFADSGWDGRVHSPLIDFVPSQPAPLNHLFVKADHALPLTGSIKARGGVHEILCLIERIALDERLLTDETACERLLTPAARACFARYAVVVASTGNLGFSIGLIGRTFGLQAEVHMSREATSWKKERLRALGAKVVEHDCDFTATVGRARAASALRANTHFVDDETSRELLLGYATAAHELADQLTDRGIRIGAERPLFVYLPCGVGGASGGVTFALKHLFGTACVCVFVEPVGAASMFAALSTGAAAPVHVTSLGLRNATFADGLAVPSTSPLVLDVVGNMIDASVALEDEAIATWVRRAWHEGGLRLEPAAAAGFSALEPFLAEANVAPAHSTLSRWRDAVHIVWTTGGSLMPDAEFLALLAGNPDTSPSGR